MKVLVADDDALYRRVVQAALEHFGYGVCAVADGAAAWETIGADEAVEMAILDWEMPGLTGLEVCRRVRQLAAPRFVYAILLTGKSEKRDVIAGLGAGADDYVTKPFDREELYARLQVGARVLRLQQDLARQVRELGEALARVQQLQGLLPICSYCKRVRDDGNYWQQVEHYLSAHSELRFSHGICPKCYESVVEPQLRAVKRKATP
jgi:DNA-binding response OmpR family regulator